MEKQKFYVGQKVSIVRKVEYTGSEDYSIWEDEMDLTVGKIGIVKDAAFQHIIKQWIYVVETKKTTYDFLGYLACESIVSDGWWYLGESLEPTNCLIKYLL
jgi:hypothetical protein